MGLQVEICSSRAQEGFKRTLSGEQEIFLGNRREVSLSENGDRPRRARYFAHSAGYKIEPVANAPLSINGKSTTGPTQPVDGEWVTFKSSFSN